jgi:AraC-like DNA-binding protein
MLSIIIFLITSTLGFLCLFSIFKNQNKYDQTYINKYLIILFSIVSIRFFLLGLLKANPEFYNKIYLGALDTLLMITMPCYYLYFRDLTNQAKFNKLNLLHFAVPFLSIVFYIIFLFVDIENKLLIKKTYLFTSIVICITYFSLGYRLLNKNVWNREVDINSVQKQNLLMKKWTKFLFYSFFVIYFLRVIPMVISYLTGTENNLLWLTGPFWSLLFIIVITTPEILFGFNFLNKTIDNDIDKIVLRPVWNINEIKDEIVSEKDKKLEDKIKPFILAYVHQIEELSFHSHAFRNTELTINDIANSLNIPSSHVNFVFKYHCNESFSDYKKIVRIHDATKLINEGYLKKNKVETLSEFVGFSSYTTFYLAFKSITGVTMQEYVRRF